jgi:prepilin-type N-terminal cleavage/methylation domain-containing protein
MKQRLNRGFTLIELAVVTAVIGLLAAGAVASFGAIRTNTKIKETHRALKSAELLLQAYVARNQRLPCPANPGLTPDDTGYGLQHNIEPDQYGANGEGSGCSSFREEGLGSNIYWGTLPSLTLGRPVAGMTDGWNHQVFYAVNGDAARTDSLIRRSWEETNPICLWNDHSDIPGPFDCTGAVQQHGVVMLMSAGANGYRARSVDGNELAVHPAGADNEKENIDGDIMVVRSNYSEDPDDPFDEVIRVLTEDDIVMPLAQIGAAQTKIAVIKEKMERIIDAMFAYAAEQTDDPDGTPSYIGAEVNPDPICVKNGGPVSSGSGTFYYNCDKDTRTLSRRLPKSDSNPDDALGSGGGRGDAVGA